MLRLFKNQSASIALYLSVALASFSLHAHTPPAVGKFAEQQTRYIATYFPGRMSGSPAEFLTAQYIQQQFNQLGYRTELRREAGQVTPSSATSVIATYPGQLPQEILIITHTDTPSAESEPDHSQNKGGLHFQGVDNNAASLGVMLEVAKRLAHCDKRYGLRFVALSGTQPPHQGITEYLNHLSIAERKDTLLVVDIENIVAGKNLAFLSGNNTATAVRKQTIDRAKQIAQQHDIHLLTAQLASSQSRTLTDFEKMRLPYMAVTASQATKLTTLAAGERLPLLEDDAAKDNLAYIDQHYPHRLQQRSQQVVTILTPLLRGLLTPVPSPAVDHYSS